MTKPSIAESTTNDRSFETRSVWDPQSECTFVVSTPTESPELWESFLAGAWAGYRKHGVEKALEYERICDGASTALFFAAVRAGGEVVGGVRAQGPYTSVDECHATIEWAGYPDEATVRRMIQDRLPCGVVEMKSAWVADVTTRRKALTLALARMASYPSELMEVQFLMATAGVHVLDLWKTSGYQVAEQISAVPYPDDRFQTKIIWRDSNVPRDHADAAQLQRLMSPSHSPAPVASIRQRRSGDSWSAS